jgi:4-hydroxybenzoate polyprenyltransferase
MGDSDGEGAADINCLTTIHQPLPEPLHAPTGLIGVRVLVSAVRPRQWIKNLLLFAGILFAGRLGDPAALLQAILGFVAFCAAASAAYVMNDLRDAPADRLHPRKRLRPIASGALSRGGAVWLAAVLAVVSIAAASLLGPQFALLLGLFALLQVAYTFALKRVVLADIATISMLFVIRAAAGAAAVSVRISPWLLICTFLLAFFLACAKRSAELRLVAAGSAPGRAVLRRYPPAMLDWLIRVDAVAIAVVYTAYAVTAVSGPWMVLTAPFVIVGLGRYLHLMRRGEGEEPERTLLCDRPLRLSVAAWAVVAILVIAI